MSEAREEMTHMRWVAEGVEYVIKNVPVRRYGDEIGVPSAEHSMLILVLQDMMEAGIFKNEIDMMFFDEHFDEIFGE